MSRRLLKPLRPAVVTSLLDRAILRRVRRCPSDCELMVHETVNLWFTIHVTGSGDPLAFTLDAAATALTRRDGMRIIDSTLLPRDPDITADRVKAVTAAVDGAVASRESSVVGDAGECSHHVLLTVYTDPDGDTRWAVRSTDPNNAELRDAPDRPAVETSYEAEVWQLHECAGGAPLWAGLPAGAAHHGDGRQRARRNNPERNAIRVSTTNGRAGLRLHRAPRRHRTDGRRTLAMAFRTSQVDKL